MRLIKKIATMILAISMVLALSPATVLASDTITVTIDGEAVVFADQQPVIINNRTLVPVGGVFEALGFTPSWSGSTQTATLTRDDFTVVITIGSATFTTNGEEHTLDVPAQIINNRTMLPLRAVLESIGIAPENIGWDGNTRAITIITGVEVSPPVDPAVAEAELTTFLSGMDMDLIRFGLGVDFTVGMTEYAWDANTTWRFLQLDGELDFDFEFGGGEGAIRYNTKTGDVTLHRVLIPGFVYGYLVRVDMGSTIDLLTTAGLEIPHYVTENHRVHHIIFTAALYETTILSIAHFLHMSGHNTVQDILGVNFTLDSDEQADGWFNNVLLLHPATPIDITNFEPNDFSDTLVSQTGDAFILSYGGGEISPEMQIIYLFIDIGSILDFVPRNMISDISEWRGVDLTENARAYYRIRLFPQ